MNPRRDCDRYGVGGPQPCRRTFLTSALALASCRAWVAGRAYGSTDDPLRAPEVLADPIEAGPFLVPRPDADARPVWGVRGGISVGLWPQPGPRGLLRIYTPYVGQPANRVINFIAVEPVEPDGRRGLSELEPSRRDGLPGKAMIPATTRDAAAALAGQPWRPPAARIERVEGDDRLTLVVGVEPFDNGACVTLEVLLHASRPHEVDLRVFATPARRDRMPACILTATMGNYARLRKLWLKDRVVRPAQLWPDTLAADGWGFLPHHSWDAEELLHTPDGQALLAATTDETEPEAAAGQPRGWLYRGRPATQYWRAPAQEGLKARVNARRTYWMSQTPIPGGPSYENMELEAPFVDGQRWTFGVHPGPPSELGFPAEAAEQPRATPIEAHDPTLVREGDYYYVASTGRGRLPWLPLRRSRDLKNWDELGQLFEAPPAWIDAEGRQVRSLWAPEITRYRDRYHLLYCASRFGTNDSTIARASSPTLDPTRADHAWTDHGPLLTSRPGRNPWNAIDPHLAIDEWGQPWLAFGSFWDGIQLVRLDSDSLMPRMNATMHNIASRGGDRSIEAPFLHRHDGWWYLFVSFDLCCRGIRSTYRIMVGRSRSIAGPYVDRDDQPMREGGGTELVAAQEGDPDRGPGHCSVLNDGERTWLAHHAYDSTRGGRPVLRVRPLDFAAEGWPSAGRPVGL